LIITCERYGKQQREKSLLDQVYADAGQKMIRRVHAAGVHLFKSRLHAQVLRATGRLLGDPQQHPLITLVAARHFEGHHEIAPKQHQAGGSAFAQRGRPQAEPEETETRAEVRVVSQRGQHISQRHCYVSYDLFLFFQKIKYIISGVGRVCVKRIIFNQYGHEPSVRSW